MKDRLVYFDYMATTPIDEQVLEQMLKYMGPQAQFANPASQHIMGQQALEAVEAARAQVAKAVNANAEEVVWTSGATESDNLAIKGVAEFYKRNGNHVITSLTEHKAVLDCFKHLERNGFEVTYLRPNEDGLISAQQVQQAMTTETILVSIMHVNNEIGVIQPLDEIGHIVKEQGAIFHVDAAQSVGKVKVDVKAMKADLVSFSGHKAYGPKGIGALYINSKPRVRLALQMHGGGHERGFRSGTLATHQIVGMGEAFEIATNIMDEEHQRISTLCQYILEKLQVLDGVHINGSTAHRVPNNLNISFEGVDGDSLQYALSDLCLSSTSACASASIEPSHVLTSIGLPNHLAHAAIRLSMGRYTTLEDVEYAAEKIVSQVQRLRSMY